MYGSRGRANKIYFQSEKGYALCQQNGQRTYGGPPPNWGNKPPPSRDCEVFIGRLPRTCFEDELIPLFLSVGELYEFRLMLDFSGTNRGYGYAHYAKLEYAEKAILTLNRYEIRPGHRIGVLKSKNNCRLLFGNISAVNVEGFSDFIRKTTEEVLNVVMFKNFLELKQTDFRISEEVEEAFLSRVPRNNRNNQFAIVEYENHKAAAVARRVLIPKYGHILAIDWAVPPRERKGTGPGPALPVTGTEKSLSITPVKDPCLLPSKSTSKIRPVPILAVLPSPYDNVPFMPKNFRAVVKFFKYQLSVCLYKSVNRLEIPLFICKEIERKIVDRITNVENCSQAVQLIFNYFSWCNERQKFITNFEIQKLLQEVKLFADSFVSFLNKRLEYGPSQNLAEDNYYINSLPLQLNILFLIILHSDAELQAKLSSGIATNLKWLAEVVQKEDKLSEGFTAEIMNLIKNEDSASLDRASALAKSRFLHNIIANQQSQNLGSDIIADLPMQKYFLCKSNENIKSNFRMENVSPRNKTQESDSSNIMASSPQNIYSDINLQNFKVGFGHYVSMPFFQTEKLKEEKTEDLNLYPPVPILFVQSSIMSKVPFMPDMFINVLTYFKHLIRIYVNINAWQMNVPHQISIEIGRKIIDRISNMENCAEGVQLILNYFSSVMKKRQCVENLEVQKLLQEVKMYADSFVSFFWSKTLSSSVPDEATENYFCKVLPLRLNLLYYIMLIFNSEKPTRCLVGITKGLTWLKELIQKGDKTAKLFLGELTRFIVELDPASYERAKNLGKVVCTELMNSNGQYIKHDEPLFSFTKNDDIFTDKNSQNSSSNAKVSSSLSTADSGNASEDTPDHNFCLF